MNRSVANKCAAKSRLHISNVKLRIFNARKLVRTIEIYFVASSSDYL